MRAHESLKLSELPFFVRYYCRLERVNIITEITHQYRIGVHRVLRWQRTNQFIQHPITRRQCVRRQSLCQNRHLRLKRGTLGLVSDCVLVALCPVIVFECPYNDLPAELQEYIFEWSDLDRTAGNNMQAIAMGYGGMYNCDNPANMRYESVTEGARLMRRFVAGREIKHTEQHRFRTLRLRALDMQNSIAGFPCHPK